MQLQNVEIYSNWKDPSMIEWFISIMSTSEPLFIGRVGGSDYEIIREYFYNNKNYIKHGSNLHGNNINKDIKTVKEMNGYFDFSNNLDNFIQYLEDMVSFYKEVDLVTYCTLYTINSFTNNNFSNIEAKFLQYILLNKKAIPFSFIEAIYPFLESFKIWGENKKILIISPLSDSVNFQNKYRNELVLNYEYPNFELITYNTPITYNQPTDTKENLQIVTNNWHEQCSLMVSEISKIDFDIAWLSCGSYAMCLGNFIKKNLGKKAIYIGGPLNLFFNIYGGRFIVSHKEINNIDTQIEAFENTKVQNIAGGKLYPSEALNAYFGTREKGG